MSVFQSIGDAHTHPGGFTTGRPILFMPVRQRYSVGKVADDVGVSQLRCYLCLANKLTGFISSDSAASGCLDGDGTIPLRIPYAAHGTETIRAP